MKPLITLILVFIFFSVDLTAQRVRSCPGLELAIDAWAKGDTAATIEHLTKFYRSNTDNMLVAQACLRIGQLYVAKGEMDSAVKVLEDGLTYKATWVCESGDYKQLLPMHYSAARGYICVLLSEIARRESDHNRALYHLLMADTKFVAWSGCGTGMESFRMIITPPLVDAYLNTGDSSKAIKRLFQYVLYDYDVMEKLKPFLLRKYTHEQIKQEFKRAVAAIKKVVEKKGNEKRSYTVFTAFGHTLFKDDYTEPQSLRQYIAQNPRLDWFRN